MVKWQTPSQGNKNRESVIAQYKTEAPDRPGFLKTLCTDLQAAHFLQHYHLTKLVWRHMMQVLETVSENQLCWHQVI